MIKHQRVDKWLWHARVVKTRTLAQKLVTSGKIRIDSRKVAETSRRVSAGNVLTITLPNEIKILEVLGFSEKRGPYQHACQLYKDRSPPKENRRSSSDYPSRGEIIVEGAPDRRERKLAIRLKQNSG